MERSVVREMSPPTHASLTPHVLGNGSEKSSRPQNQTLSCDETDPGNVLMPMVQGACLFLSNTDGRRGPCRKVRIVVHAETRTVLHTDTPSLWLRWIKPKRAIEKADAGRWLPIVGKSSLSCVCYWDVKTLSDSPCCFRSSSFFLVLLLLP